MVLLAVVRSSISTNKRLFRTSATNLTGFKKWYRGLWEPKMVGPPYSHVTQIGDPILRKKSEPVPTEAVKSNEMNLLIEQMIDVLRKYELVGVAAPQIGIGLRIIAMEFREDLVKKFPPAVYGARQMSPLPMTVVINPILKVTNFNKVKFPEGCASVKGFSADVERYEEVNLKGVSRTGEEIDLNLKDIMDRSTFNCTCWEAINAHEGRVEIRFTPK
ncbi:unnamed protein product [Hermetia illucens]|uniref:Peptide deformylase n=1 Tax=Hermetia illucens TaxID=343691 RepID=A0A7R8YUH0_HERIL|nr:unnamed protein product [Hermetia illucens]